MIAIYKKQFDHEFLQPLCGSVRLPIIHCKNSLQRSASKHAVAALTLA